eukprot:g292.t1
MHVYTPSDMKKSFENLHFGNSIPSLGEPQWYWKEKHYFGGGFEDYYGDLNRYLRHYPACSENASETNEVAADFTPELTFDFSANRILETYGKDISNRIVFIVMLRDPVQRMASEFLFMMFHKYKGRGTPPSRRFLLWRDFDAYVTKYPETKAWPSWEVHHRTRDEMLNHSNDIASKDEVGRDNWIMSTFGRWVDAQLAMAASCHFRDNVPLARLWPDCGRRSIFSSIYSAQLLHWFRTFSPKQFVVTSMSAYVSAPSTVLNAVGHRMGLRCRSVTVRREPSALQPAAIPSKQHRPCDVPISKASHLNEMPRFGADDLLNAMRMAEGKHEIALRSLTNFYGMFDDSLRLLLESSSTLLGSNDREGSGHLQLIVPDAKDLRLSDLRKDPVTLHRPWSLSKRNLLRVRKGALGTITADFETLAEAAEGLLDRIDSSVVRDVIEGRLPVGAGTWH